MDNFNGIIYLTLLTAPKLRTFKTKDNSTAEYYELTLGDGYNVYNGVSGSASFDFTTLETGKTYGFSIMARKKTFIAVGGNGSQYNRSVCDFKVVGVPTSTELKTFLMENAK